MGLEHRVDLPAMGDAHLIPAVHREHLILILGQVLGVGVEDTGSRVNG